MLDSYNPIIIDIPIIKKEVICSATDFSGLLNILSNIYAG